MAVTIERCGFGWGGLNGNSMSWAAGIKSLEKLAGPKVWKYILTGLKV